MSVRAMTWALETPVGGTAKILLLGLADHAHADGACAFPSLERLAIYAFCDRSTVIRNLKKLELTGWIRRDGKGPNGQVSYQLAVPAEGGILPPPHQMPQVAPMPPKPSLSGKEEGAKAPEKIAQQPAASPDAAVDADPVTRVWGCYVEEMGPRRKTIDPESRRVIRSALVVASAEECCAAIRGCKASDFHMGQNDRGRKYNRLTQILKGKQGIRTTREQVDLFLDVLERVGGLSVDPAKVSRAKRAVLDAWEFPQDAEVRKRGDAGADWLARHSYRIDRDDETGQPRFVRL